MRRLIAVMLAGFLVFGSTAAATAQPITPKQAKKLLFKGRKLNVQLLDLSGLEATTRAQAEAIATSLTNPKIAAQWAAMGFSINYYGAMAVKPDQPLSPKSMAISNNLHSPDAAMAAALAACNALPGPECAPVALILPKRYKARDFTLSQSATGAFRDNWGRPKEPQYLAFSLATGAYVIAKGAGADATALASCNAQAEGHDDCVIGIASE